MTEGSHPRTATPVTDHVLTQHNDNARSGAQAHETTGQGQLRGERYFAA
jgi:hypothetical protein